MASAFISPDTPRWTPSTESDIQDAIEQGLLEETHWVELKREIESGRSANRELARDLASLAIDGGTLIVGIGQTESALSRTPQSLSGLPERVEQIARSIPDPPIAIQSTPIPSTGDTSTGYLLVHVPPSGQAPHMVDNKYMGRGDKTKIYLSDAEVLRLHARRRASEEDILELLDVEISRDPISGDERRLAHLFLVAEPIPGRSEMSLDLVSGPDWQQRMVNLRDQCMAASVTEGTGLTGFSPDLDSAYNQQRRPHGAALAPANLRGDRSPSENGLRENGAIELEISEDGQLRLYCGRLSDELSDYVNGPSRFTLFDQGAALLVRRFLAAVVKTAEHAGYLGNWGIGVALTGLRGLRSYEHDRNFGSYGPEYSEDNYKRAAIASYTELVQTPGRVTNNLLGRLLRALATDQRLASALSDPEPSDTASQEA